MDLKTAAVVTRGSSKERAFQGACFSFFMFISLNEHKEIEIEICLIFLHLLSQALARGASKLCLFSFSKVFYTSAGALTKTNCLGPL